jgi:hypothetical protein
MLHDAIQLNLLHNYQALRGVAILLPQQAAEDADRMGQE